MAESHLTEHHVTHPFIKVEEFGGNISWSIGCEVHQDRMGGDTWVAHGEGKKIIKEISRHTPKGYREKVFFTVEYTDPDGNAYSKKRLQMLGIRAFQNRVAGFAFEYDVEST
ncbi:hypothetical protein [Halocynthiibacter sp.]|uniref:hypothetical protein n=1 Tax=Halocynthiibacter sp. TaxID=1979210 RepID=UPI003C37BE1B